MERRCPRLGGFVRFGYCQEVGDDALTYLKNRISAQDFEILMKSRPKPKITGLLQLIEQAQKRSCIND